MSYTLNEIAFLHSQDAEITAIGQTLPLSKTSMLSDATTLRERFGEHGRAAAELLNARRSALDKLPAGWLACHESAQQATPLPVAQVRAAHLRAQLGGDAIAHDVTCSIGTEGAALAGAGLGYLGSDLDATRTRMAFHNLAGTPGTLIFRADALVPASTSADVILADPARREGGRRITDPAKLIPPLPDLLAAWPGSELAIKCAPGLDFSQWQGMVSVSSVEGAVKEACLYTPGLSDGARREAIMIDRTGVVDRLDDRLDDHAGEDLAAAPGRFIIDPDGAVVRAGLVRHYAVREGLWMLDERIAYLTGDRLPAGRSGFEFIEQVPLKKLRAALAGRDVGSLEILVRGVDVDPDQLRRKLKLKGSKPMAVVCTRIGSTGVALICGPRVWATTVEDKTA
ncbi:THUMP-like domain-containing protein [Corynebacterium sp. A21]|uniref:THUMP-like domain-containing protein n=1 Tax=Corynebacterium sp. A21 TaxID=3457318 RepID=UPI003FD4DABD